MLEPKPLSPLCDLEKEDRTPAFYKANGLQLQECPTACAILVTAHIDNAPALRTSLEKLLKVPLPGPNAISTGRMTILWQGPRDYLLLGEKPGQTDMLTDLESLASGKALIAADYSSAITRISVSGDAIRDFLSVCVLVDTRKSAFPSATCLITRIDSARVTLVRRKNGVDIIARRTDSWHLWRWLCDAADGFEASPAFAVDCN